MALTACGWLATKISVPAHLPERPPAHLQIRPVQDDEGEGEQAGGGLPTSLGGRGRSPAEAAEARQQELASSQRQLAVAWCLAAVSASHHAGHVLHLMVRGKAQGRRRHGE